MNRILGLIAAVALTMQAPVWAADSNAWNQATAIYNRGDYMGALTAFKKLESAYPNNGRLHYMIGVCYQKSGNVDQARRELSWVASSCPDMQVRQLAAGALAAIDHPQRAAYIPGNYKGPGKALINDSVNQTIRAAAQAGWKPCTNPLCLNYSKDGWHHMRVAGHPPSEVWMTWKYKSAVDEEDETATGNAGDQSFSQEHIGRIISATPTQAARDIGRCRVCEGTGWIKK